MCPFPSVSVELRYQRGGTNVCHYSNSTRKVVLFGLSACPQNTGVTLTHVSANRWKKVYTFNVPNHSVPIYLKGSMVVATVFGSVQKYSPYCHVDLNLYFRTYRGTAVTQCLKCCATNRKVAGSIPDGVIGIFHWHKILPIALWPCGRPGL